MTNLPPDPGGVFDSDAHRRVLAFLRAPHDDGDGEHEAGAPMSFDVNDWETSLSERLNADQWFVMTGADADEILGDLERDGYLASEGRSYAMTDAGFDALNGPNAHEPPPMTEAMVDALVSNGDLSEDEVAAWREASDAWETNE